MDDPEEHALVIKALTQCPPNCIRWKRGLFERVLGDPDLRAIHPNRIVGLFVEAARLPGGIKQQRVTDEEYRDEGEFQYWAVVQCEEIARGIYVKCTLFDDDAEFPQVKLVSIHQATFKVPPP